MDDSRRICERLWNMPDKGELESHREETFIDDIIQKSHLDKITFVKGALEVVILLSNGDTRKQEKSSLTFLTKHDKMENALLW